MEVFIHAATQMAILCALVACGFIARKKGMMNNEFDSKLSTLVMTFCFPAMILDSVLANQNIPGPEVILPIFGYSFIIYLFAVVFSYVFVRFIYRGVKLTSRGVYAFTMAFGNVGFIGFAVINSLFGSDAVLLAAVFNIPYNVFLFSIGMMFISRTGKAEKSKSRKTEIKAISKCFISPVMIASYIAVILALLQVSDSGPIGTAVSMLGDATVPVAMLITGSSLAKLPAREMLNDGWSYLTTFMRLVGMPLIVFFLFGFIIPDKEILAIIVVLTATPAATVGTMMCVSYGGDLKTMTRCTFLTTVLSLATIPLMALLVM